MKQTKKSVWVCPFTKMECPIYHQSIDAEIEQKCPLDFDDECAIKTIARVLHLRFVEPE
jgi:hypothetical protein